MQGLILVVDDEPKIVKRMIKVVLHDPQWSQQFEREVEELTAIFGEEIVKAHHIGSTAIPGIVAKPIIDVLVEVRDIKRIDGFNQAMTPGYIPKGAFGIAGRRFFIKGSETHRTHHIHVFGLGHRAIDRHLAFRDYLRAHPDEAQAYGRLKTELARRFPHDINGYTAGKDDFIKDIERKAAAWKRTEERANGT
jgi:GrpB-like predicted nucleotidyltransferase (UPF0157 family)